MLINNYLPKDPSYKTAFIFAVTLHVMLMVFLVVKLTSSNQFVTESSVNIIKAVAINNFPSKQPVPVEVKTPEPQVEQKEIPKEIQKPEPQKTTELKVKSTKTLEILQKRLLAEQAEESKELKKQVANKKAMQQAAIQKAMQQAMAKEKSELASTQLSVKAEGEVDKYKALIIQAIASEWVIPENIDENASCKLLVTVAPKGIVMNVQLIQGSGNALLDRSAKTAVLKASPLPVPVGALFDNFRTIRLTVKPQGMVSG